MTTTLLAAEELNPLVPHPVEIIVGLIAFGLLFLLLRRMVFPQFEKVYAERTEKIEGGLARAEEAQEQANELKRQYEEQLAGLRAEAARIRDRARALRAEFTRHSKQPNWDLVNQTIGEPLVELRDAVGDELLRRQSNEALVPIDRDPVPPEFAESVRRYYERLGNKK